MQPVSELYLQIIRSGNYYVESKLIIDNSTATIDHLSPNLYGVGENRLMSLKTTRRVFSNNVPEVGCCPCGEIYVDLLMPDVEVPRMAMLIPYIRLVSTENNQHSEWLRKGVYYIDTRDNTQNLDDIDILSIHGYDAMMRAEVEYGEYFTEIDCTLSSWTKSGNKYVTSFSDSKISTNYDISIEYIDAESKKIASQCSVTITSVNGNKVNFQANSQPSRVLIGKIVLRKKNTLGFPATDVDTIIDIAGKMNIEIDEDTIAFNVNGTPKEANQQPYFNQEYTVQYPASYSMRETLGYIASMYGGNFVMNDIGKLQFIPIWGLPIETSLLIDNHGDRIVFGEGADAVRILVKELTRGA